MTQKKLTLIKELTNNNLHTEALIQCALYITTLTCNNYFFRIFSAIDDIQRAEKEIPDYIYEYRLDKFKQMMQFIKTNFTEQTYLNIQKAFGVQS